MFQKSLLWPLFTTELWEINVSCLWATQPVVFGYSSPSGLRQGESFPVTAPWVALAELDQESPFHPLLCPDLQDMEQFTWLMEAERLCEAQGEVEQCRPSTSVPRTGRQATSSQGPAEKDCVAHERGLPSQWLRACKTLPAPGYCTYISSPPPRPLHLTVLWASTAVYKPSHFSVAQNNSHSISCHDSVGWLDSAGRSVPPGGWPALEPPATGSNSWRAGPRGDSGVSGPLPLLHAPAHSFCTWVRQRAARHPPRWLRAPQSTKEEATRSPDGQELEWHSITSAAFYS